MYVAVLVTGNENYKHLLKIYWIFSFNVRVRKSCYWTSKVKIQKLSSSVVEDNSGCAIIEYIEKIID